jgi:LysM repeat protein
VHTLVLDHISCNSHPIQITAKTNHIGKLQPDVKEGKMAENTPDTDKKPMEETINALRYNLGAGIIKKDKPLRYIVGLLVLTILLAVFLGFQQYSLSQQLNEMAINLTNLELRIGGLEKQQADLQAKSLNSAIVSEVGTLSAKVSAFEKQMTSSQARKKSSTDSSTQSKAVKKRYHEVKKGETLYRISKQYGITVDELRRLNKLSSNQPIEVGQKLLVSKR